MKNMTLPVAVAVAIIGCVLAVSANVTTSKMHEDLDQERYKRMSAEKQLQKAHAAINRFKTELSDARNKIQGIQEILNVGQSARESLKGELESVSQEREALRKERESLMKKVEQLQKESAPQASQEEVPSP